MSKDEYPLQTAIELACAAQRLNKDYIKHTESIYTSDAVFVGYKWANKQLMVCALDPAHFNHMGEDKPPLLCTNLADRDFANEIQKYYRRLLFNAVAGDVEFYTTLNSILSSPTVPLNQLGFIACLPHVYRKDVAKKRFDKLVGTLEQGYVGDIGQQLLDKDCEIISSSRSKNYDAWNVLAVIDNKLVSWMGNYELTTGPCVIVRAKVKDQGKNWKTQHDETRLNYVKAAQ